MIVRGEAFDLKPAVSASGDRYDALDGTDTRFWSKGDRAVVTVAHFDDVVCNRLLLFWQRSCLRIFHADLFAVPVMNFRE